MSESNCSEEQILAFHIGDLVESEMAFSGIAKLVSMDESTETGTVAFFESPIRNSVRPVDVRLHDLRNATIFDETTVIVLDEDTGIWRRARYGARHPDGKHLITFSRDDSARVALSEINVLNLSRGADLDPIDFLEARCCDTPLFSEWRLPFVRSYIEQRAACRSISSILSSSVEIEPHQVAVVRQVLADDTRRYLLADEVGLGKTIEACLIMREHVLQDQQNALVIVSVPKGLICQWEAELTDRFYLGDLLNERIFVCSHEKLAGALKRASPTMLVVDEAHLIAPWAWSEDSTARSDYQFIADRAINAKSVLLLSGTPLTGNEENFLAMLHLLSPEIYQLSSSGVQAFKQKLSDREQLGGMYQALVPTNDNDSLTAIVSGMTRLFPDDQELHSLCEQVIPLVDWRASEEGDERELAIAELRSYLGESYRIHQRMLRNRREDAAIAHLFPGLAGATIVAWSIDEPLLIDQILDAHREEYIGASDELVVVKPESIVSWIEDYLVSPILVSQRAEQALLDERIESHSKEREVLKELLYCGKKEQVAKDDKLMELVSQWLADHGNGKIIIFTTSFDQADRVFEIMRSQLGDFAERHSPKLTPKFQSVAEIRVLVCDEEGEDGLNLHGGEKLIIHYAVPLSFSRIEQRNGRVNRYSAAIRAKPIRSIILVPESRSYAKNWADLLVNDVGIFDRSVASLQYVLQEEIDSTWQKVVTDGPGALLELSERLTGPSGLLEQERRRVNAQEELNSMNSEVLQAKEFANELEIADEVAETQCSRMVRWIAKGLQFEKKQGDIRGSFRFGYQNGSRGPRTLVDVRSLVSKSLTGIDKPHSDWSNLVTAMMSPDRQLASHGRQVYPMRFGQPFVDTIFDLMRHDTRGTCSAWIRAVRGLASESPSLFFRCTWIVDGCESHFSAYERRLADEEFRPRVLEAWLDEAGEVVKDAETMRFLQLPYSAQKIRTGQRRLYKDMRIRHDTWGDLEDYFPLSKWLQVIGGIRKKSLNVTMDEAIASPKLEFEGTVSRLESVSAVILVRGNA